MLQYDMYWICPACGLRNNEDISSCACGYLPEILEGMLIEEDELSEETNQEESNENSLKVVSFTQTPQKQEPDDVKVKVFAKPPLSKSAPVSDEIVVKEIDSWKFCFSPADNCIYAGTPALYPFRLKMTLSDMLELIEFMCEKSGIPNPMQKRQLSGADVLGFVQTIETMIEAKRAKTKITFSINELQEITEIINKKLRM